MDMTTPKTRPDDRWLASTHEVTNVARELIDLNLYREDRALVDAVRREGAAWADDSLASFGALAGSASGWCAPMNARAMSAASSPTRVESVR